MKPLLDIDKIMTTDKFYEEIHQINIEYYEFWKKNTLWHWEFYLSIILAVIPWVIWFFYRKKGSEGRLLLVGSFVLIITSWLDFLGVTLGIWHYSGKFIPTIPSYLPWDFCLLPVITMLFIQFKPNMQPFLKAIIYGALIAFIGEPLMEWVGLYTSGKWHNYYSFPIYIIIYLISFKISKINTFNNI
jgi:hypothetical protein